MHSGSHKTHLCSLSTTEFKICDSRSWLKMTANPPQRGKQLTTSKNYPLWCKVSIRTLYITVVDLRQSFTVATFERIDAVEVQRKEFEMRWRQRFFKKSRRLKTRGNQSIINSTNNCKRTLTNYKESSANFKLGYNEAHKSRLLAANVISEQEVWAQILESLLCLLKELRRTKLN
jgi:hypothetical protein